MPTPMLLFILFIAGTTAGAISAYRLIVASRKAGQRSDALCEWSEMPLPTWRYEPYAITAILFHTFAVMALTVAALHAASNPGILNNPLFANDTNMIAMGWFIQCGSIGLIGYQLGPLLIAIPLIILRREPLAYAITEKGMVLGRNLLPWRWFSHLSIDSDGGILRLYSAFSPDLPSLISKPPESVPLVELSNTIHGFLPLYPSKDNRAWYRTKFLLIPTMLLVCLPVVAAGWLAFRLPRELSLFVIALLASILIFLGGKVISLFAFGVLSTRSNSPK